MRQGPTKVFHRDGTIEQQGQYAQDKEVGTWVFRMPTGVPGGKYTKKNGAFHGAYIQYHPNGIPRITGKYQNGKKHGTWTFLTADGQLLMRIYYKKGIEMGREDPKRGK
jgi:antitoxin component YwqK of YwqJK toxin-antitoxin module